MSHDRENSQMIVTRTTGPAIRSSVGNLTFEGQISHLERHCVFSAIGVLSSYPVISR